jgi:hypothetical protein
MKVASLFLLTMFLISFASAECTLSASLVNQDPYPAVPGDYVKLVFQLNGVKNPTCGQVTFKLLEKYPIRFDPETSQEITINSGTFTKDHSSYLMAPYKVRVDENALDGENPIEVDFAYGAFAGTASHQSKQFNLEVEDVKADFEITIKNYEANTNTLTLEILNIGESDIEALTLEIPDQEKINVKGAHRNIVGDLDSNDYTTADFEAVPKDGEIMVSVLYTDSINTRRNLQKTVVFNSEYFQDRSGDEGGTSIWSYVFIVVVIGGIIWWWRRRNKKKQAHAHRHH